MAAAQATSRTAGGQGGLDGEGGPRSEDRGVQRKRHWSAAANSLEKRLQLRSVPLVLLLPDDAALPAVELEPPEVVDDSCDATATNDDQRAVVMDVRVAVADARPVQQDRVVQERAVTISTGTAISNTAQGWAR